MIIPRLLQLLDSNHLPLPRKCYAKLSKIPYKNPKDQFGKVYFIKIMEDYPGKITASLIRLSAISLELLKN